MQRIRWKGFEIPTKVELVANSSSATEGEYGKFVAEPFERGFGITVGNALRRALLSSIEGIVPVALRIKNVPHEFTSIPGVREDIVNIVMNVRGILLRFNGEGPETITIEKKGVGPVLAKHFRTNAGVELVNPEWQIATLENESAEFVAEVEFRKGRGYVRIEDFPWKVDESIGAIPMAADFRRCGKFVGRWKARVWAR